GLAALGLLAPVYMIFNVFDLGMAIGGSVHYTKLLGEGKAKEGVGSFNQMLQASLFLSLLMAIFGRLFLPQIMMILGTNPSDGVLYEAARSYAGILILAAPLFFLNFMLYFYVRCDDNQKLASVGLIIGNVVDILLNFIFVIILNKGVEGAVFATVIGKALAICIYLPHLFFKSTIIRLKYVKPNIKLIWNNFKNGFSTSSQYIFQFLLFLIINNLLIRLGGENTLAIFNVVINVSYVLIALYDGMGSIIQPLVGTFYGEKNKKAEIFTLILGLKWGIALGTLMALLIGIFAGPIGTTFGLNVESLTIGTKALRLYCISTIIGGISVMMSYYYQAVGEGKLVFLINFLRTFAVYLTFGLLFCTFGIKFFWWTFPATEAVSLILWLLWKSYQNKRKCDHLESMFDESRILCKTVEKNEDFSRLTAEAQEFCNKWSASFSQRYYVNLTVEELCQAIILNGFASMEGGYIELTLIANEDNSFELHIRDNATELNLFDLHTKKINRDNEEGLDSIGLLMVKNRAKEIFYRRYQGFNTITVKV
ncbi:MAG: MATE family efflux transporter, partial [Herbinix sp.]|nr:MATE family efflux transporter [Herbinix sp.]